MLRDSYGRIDPLKQNGCSDQEMDMEENKSDYSKMSRGDRWVSGDQERKPLDVL
jgi:hypothetical protein